jgi:hypothetical protein
MARATAESRSMRMTTRRDRSADATAPTPMIRDEEVSQEVMLRRLVASASLNMSARDTSTYRWETVVRSRTRTAPLPPNFVAPVLDGQP